MEKMIFLDTCILIDYLKQKDFVQSIIREIFSLENCYINDIVAMELIQGARCKSDLRFILNKLNNFKILDMNQSVMNKSREILTAYFLSHNLRIPDAIIASTCILYGIHLWTHNTKDFAYIENISL
jgi:tRNA(fMet)-specific endonuclease VapC